MYRVRYVVHEINVPARSARVPPPRTDIQTVRAAAHDF